jgi:hypothetical protein
MIKKKHEIIKELDQTKRLCPILKLSLYLVRFLLCQNCDTSDNQMNDLPTIPAT